MNFNRIEDVETWIRTHFFGKYRGTVVDNLDILGQKGRLKVEVPAVLGDQAIWAMPCVPYAGSDVGFYFLPPTGAGVWIEFEGGDPSYPIWTGCFWADGELPSEILTSDTRILKTENTHFKVDDLIGDVELTNTQGATTTWSLDISDSVGPSTHTVGAVGVVSESTPGKVEVGPAGVTINNGAFKVT